MYESGKIMTTAGGEGRTQYRIRPWEYNPSRLGQRVVVAIVAAVGFVIASYMGLYQWKLLDFAWDPVFGRQTEEVLDSDVSHMMYRQMRIPDAILGALAYLADAVLAIAGSRRRWKYRPWLVFLFGFVVVVVGGVSLILILMQGFVVNAWCFLCLVTAGVSAVLILLAYNEVWASWLYMYRVWQTTRSGLALWKTFWGWASQAAHDVSLTVVRAA
jgi:uncharacterized membrane protein